MQQIADAPGGITFHVHQQEDHPLPGRETADGFLEFGAQDVVTPRKIARSGRRQRLVLAEDVAIAQLFEERLVNDGAVGLFIFAKSANEGAAQDVLGLGPVREQLEHGRPPLEVRRRDEGSVLAQGGHADELAPLVGRQRPRHEDAPWLSADSPEI